MNTSVFGFLLIHTFVFFRSSLGATTALGRAHTTPAVGKFHTRASYDYGSNEEGLSGDYEDDLPRVLFSTQLKATANTQNRRKDKRKKNLCLRKKYRDYCIHGQCHYLEDLNHIACRCDQGYSGERCHIFTLPITKEVGGYNQTAALAAISAVLSLMCLTFIGILLAFRCHKKADGEVESEEKIKLEAASV
ncbi:heparin-binding EGF-like growth factor b [Hoplias malabaricus]|uniref:heparin-binding EGF-like growth factor b n=1 Tax=Hoplias malabaricus TaxID=27720 RepID=UPI003463608A